MKRCNFWVPVILIVIGSFTAGVFIGGFNEAMARTSEPSSTNVERDAQCLYNAMRAYAHIAEVGGVEDPINRDYALEQLARVRGDYSARADCSVVN